MALPLIEPLVILPLAALLGAVVLGRHAGRLILVVAPAMVLLALHLVAIVAERGPVESALGGWAPPLGIGLAVDGLAAAFILVAALVVGGAGLFALPMFTGGRETPQRFAFWPLLYGMWAALNAIFAGRDLFNLYVGLELLTLAAVALVAFGAIPAALRYVLFALMGSLAYLLGAVLLYARYGTLDMDLLRAAVMADPATLLAAGLITAGLMAKTALFPLHAWLPPAHAAAPAPASALLSALVTKASFFILLRLWFDVMPELARPALIQGLGALGAAAILYGSLLAIRQDRLKALIAYSTVAQLGYLFLIFPLAGGTSPDLPWIAGAWTGGIFHAVSHALAKAAMFLAAGLIVERLGHDRLDGLRGIGRTLPVATFAFGLSAVSLMGFPPSGGFIAKYLLLTAALASGQILWAVVMLVGGVLAAAYLFRPLHRAFSTVGDGPDPAVAPAGPSWRPAIPLVLALMSILLGLASEGPYGFLQIGRPIAAAAGLE